VLALLSGRPGRYAAHAAVLTAVVGASITYAAANKSVTLSVDGSQEKVHAFASNVGDLLDDQGIKVSDRDLVAPGANAKITDGDTVVVKYARPLTLTIDGEKKTYWTTELSVDSALKTLGVRSDGAALSASRSQPLGRGGLSMWLSTPKKVVLTVDGHNHPLTTTAPNVGALLQKQGVTLNPDDRLSVVPSTPLADGQQITLVRVTSKQVTQTESIPFKKVQKKNSDLYKGDTKVVTAGKAGKRSVTYALTYHDGKVKKKAELSSKVLKKPVTQVEQIGTKKKPATTTSGGGGGGGGSVGGDVANLNWSALADCESGGRVGAVNPAGYYGLYQFSPATWRSVGGTGLPTDHGAACT